MQPPCGGAGKVASADKSLKSHATKKKGKIVRESCEVRFSDGDDADLHFVAAATPLRLGTITGHAVTFAEVTERVRNEAVEQNERAARAVIASANES